MHKAWSSIEKVSNCLSRSSMKFHGHMGQNIANFYPNGDGFEIMDKVWHRREEVACCFFKFIHLISRSYCPKIKHFNPISVRFLGRLQLSNPSDLSYHWWISCYGFKQWHIQNKQSFSYLLSINAKSSCGWCHVLSAKTHSSNIGREGCSWKCSIHIVHVANWNN